jgi:hypothetical protein
VAIARTQSIFNSGAATTITSTTNGDLILVCAYSSTTTIPTVPGGYNTITATAGTQQAIAIGYKISTGGETTIGTWTNASWNDVGVYSGVSAIGTVSALQSGSSTSATIAAVTLQVATGTSWVVALIGAKSNSGTWPTPVGTLSRWPDATNINNTVVGYDTNAGVSTFAGTSATVSPTSRWFSMTIELLATVVVVPLPSLITQPPTPARRR